MPDLLIAAVCGLVALALLFGLVCMAVLPWLRRLAEEEAGPWCVKGPSLGVIESYLSFDSPGQWTWTSHPRLVERFPRKHDAEEWARVVGGEVVPESEVGK